MHNLNAVRRLFALFCVCLLRNFYVGEPVFGRLLSESAASTLDYLANIPILEERGKLNDQHTSFTFVNNKAPNSKNGQAGNGMKAELVKVVIPRFSREHRRVRREISSFSSYEEIGHVNVVDLGELTLELGTNEDLVTPRTSTWVYGNFSAEKPLPKCNSTAGKIRGYTGSSLAVATLCGERIMGLIRSRNGTFFIEPVADSSDNSHVIYRSHVGHPLGNGRGDRKKRSSAWEFFNLTGDTFDVSGGLETFGLEELQERNDNSDHLYTRQRSEPKVFTVEVNDNSLWPNLQYDDDEVGYFVDSAWDIIINKYHGSPSSSLPQRWLEIALAVDHSVINFHGKETVEHYVLSLMNIVSAVFRDPSLEANMQLVITRLFFYDQQKQGVVRPGNAKKSLENVNSWNRRLHLSLGPGEASHDVAVWLTRLDIGGPSGYAPVGGVCDPKRSCTLNKDEGLSSAFIIAHEMGHVLGLTHDGDHKVSNDCSDEALDGSVMAPMVSATFHKFAWSHCSRDEFKTKLGKWICLKNAPPGGGETILNGTVQTTFSMDDQCRTEFGDGYEVCRAFDITEPCSHLWCSHDKTPFVCKTKKGPPLEGTKCGANKWCINGYCQDVDVSKFGMDPVAHNPQDGGWSKWSDWGGCSRSCGTGVQFRTRKCDNPRPSYGGTDCSGSSEEWRLCSTDKCPEPIMDVRAQQCKRLPRMLNLTDERASVTWLPYESDEEQRKCQLICLGSETRELFVTGENLLDGTPCSYDNGSDICIQGICQSVGCDGKLFSGLKEDACGVCGGNNTECKQITKSHQKRIKRALSRLVVIPRMSREIKVQTNLTTHKYLNLSVAFILKNRSNKKYLIPIPDSNVYNEIVDGTRFIYKRSNGMHDLWARGPVLAEIIVLLHVSKNEVDIGVNASYSTSFYLNKTILEKTGRYGWILGGWGACTVSCGGGKRQRTVACWDRLHAKIVPKRYCSLAFKPPQPSEKCNTFSCSFQWLPGPWEPCSSTCGSNGIQSREIYCVHGVVWIAAMEESNKTIQENPWRYMVNPSRCTGPKPQTVKACYRIPCLSFWKFDEWSECSASCGSGLSTRKYQCPPPSEDETFFTCGPAPSIQRRVCTGSLTKHRSCRKKKKCLEDQSKYCSIGVLQHYCQVGAFRKLCCETCRQHRKLAPVSS